MANRADPDQTADSLNRTNIVSLYLEPLRV